MSIFNRTPNKVGGTIQTAGSTKEVTETMDIFEDLVEEGGTATVSATYSLGRDFNSEKVTFHVTVRCDQNEKCITLAGKRAFHKALEMVGNACIDLGWKVQ